MVTDLYPPITILVSAPGSCDDPAVLAEPNRILAILVTFLLGVGDAGVNNVIFTSVSQVWKDDTASAFGLMKESVLKKGSRWILIFSVSQEKIIN